MRNNNKEMGKTSKITEPCCVCGKTRDEVKGQFGRYEGKVYCGRHLAQIKKYGTILSMEYERGHVTECCVCGDKGRGNIDGKSYCRKHYLQMIRHGHILERTIYDKNEYIDHPDEGYTECVLYDKKFNRIGTTLIDLDQKDDVSKYKVYGRITENKMYAMVSMPGGEKLFLHRFIMNIKHHDYKLSECVDHINGNGLDNRKSNLRICHHSENMKNIRKGEGHVCGVAWLRENEKWTARIMNNYESIHLGNYNNFEEAVYARIKAEKEYCGEYGSMSSYYWILNSDNPIDEIRKAGFCIPSKADKEIPLRTRKGNRPSIVGQTTLSNINHDKKDITV